MAPEDIAADPVGPLADEFMERCRRGERPSVSEYTDRHPELADRIRQVFSMIMVMEQAGSQVGVGSTGAGPDSSEKHAMPERIGGYRILREIGQGGMGVVYEAEQTALGRHVALKVLPIGAARKRDRWERFQREARAAARLHHTNIVPVFEVGAEGEICYYAMQFIHGQPLDLVLLELQSLYQEGRTPAVTPQPHVGVAESKAVARSLFAGQTVTQTEVASPVGAAANTDFTIQSSPRPEGSQPPSASSFQLAGSTIAPGSRSGRWHYYRNVASVGIHVAEALEYAHREGVIHRDVKPSNLLLDTAGRVWITDFGLAHQTETLAPGEKGLTQTGEIVGTIRYMAPERFRGWSDPRSDVYSLGLTLYEMLLFQPAFDAPDQVGLMHLVTQTEPVRLRKADPQIPRDLETIILKAIDKEPARRYQSAADLAVDLKRFLEDRPILARPSSVFERTWRWCKRNRAVATFAAAFILALFLGLVGSTWQWWRAEGHATALGLREEEVRKERDKAREEHRQALEAEAQALITSGLPGQRSKSIEALQEAARLQWSPRLRDLSISALALADLRPGEAWDGWHDGSTFLVFDGPVERYARGDNRGNISVRWIDGDREQFFLPGNAEVVSGLRFSPDGRYLSAIYYRGSRYLFHVWELEARKLVLVDIPVAWSAFDFMPDSHGIVVSRRNGSIGLYELGSGVLKKDLGKGEDIRWIVVDPSGQRMALSGSGPLVEVRDLSTGTVLAELDHKSPSGVGPVAWHPQDADLLAAPAWGVYIWNVPKGKLLAHVQDRAGLTTNLTFSHCGNYFATKGYGDTTLRLYDTWTGRHLVHVPGSLSDIRHFLQFSADDRLLTCSIETPRVRLWKVELPTAYRALREISQPGTGKYISFDVSPSGGVLAAAAEGEDIGAEGVALWDLRTGRQAELLKIGRTAAVIFHPKGNALISAGDAGVYHWPIRFDAKSPDIWRIGPPRRLFAGKSENLALTKDGRRLAVQSRGLGTVIDLPDQDSLASWLSQESQRLVERVTGKNPKVQVAHAGLSRVALSPDGRWLATGTHNGKDVKIWDAQTGKPIKDLPLPGSANVAFSPDGKWLVTNCYPKYRVHETGSWVLRHEIPNSSGSPIAFRADGRVLAVQMSGFKVQLLDPATAHVFATLEPPDRDQSYAGSLCFSPDGNELFACTSELRLIHGWNLRLLGQQLAELGQPWDLPPFDNTAPVGKGDPIRLRDPVRVVADLGELAGVGHRNRSQQALIERSWQTALDEANLSIRDNPKHADGYALRAQAHQKLGRFQQAIDDFTEALNRKPGDAHLHQARGLVHYHVRQYDPAIEDLNQALSGKLIAMAEATACDHLAKLYVAGPERHRDAVKALPLARRVAELTPGDDWPLASVGAALYRLGQYREALATLNRAASANSGPTAYDQFFLAMCYHRLGETDKARKCLERGIAWRKKARLSEASAELFTSLQAEAEGLLAK